MDDPVLNSVLAYWQALRGPRAMPPRREIDPVELPVHVLPNLFLVDVKGRDFRYRLAGTAIEQQFGMSMAGHRLEDLPFGTEASSIFMQYQETVETHTPTYCEHAFIDTRYIPLHYNRLLLPLSADGQNVTELFGVCVFLPKSRSWKAGALRPMIATDSVAHSRS